MPFDIDRYTSKNIDRSKDKTIKEKNISIEFLLNRIKTTNNNVTLLLVVLICAFSYIYVEHSKIAYQEKIRNEKEIENINQKTQLDTCLSDAENNYNINWNSQCKSIGKKKDCQLPTYRANSVEKWRTEEEHQCMEKFKNNAF